MTTLIARIPDTRRIRGQPTTTSELSNIHYQINSEVREMVVIKVIFIIFWGAFMLVPLFARNADVQDHLDTLDADCRHGVES